MQMVTKQITEMIDMLPQQEQVLAYELIKRLVLAWDPEFIKVTADEHAALDQAMDEYARGDIVRLEDIAQA